MESVKEKGKVKVSLNMYTIQSRKTASQDP